MPIGFVAMLVVMLAAAVPEPQPSGSPLPNPPMPTPPPGRMMYTADMAPIGTPIHVMISNVAADAKNTGIPLMLQVTDDVVVGGRTIVTKGDAGFANPVSGGMVVIGGGTSCQPTVGLSTVTALQFMNRTPVFPGVTMANHHQLVPVSFGNPSVPGSQNLFEVSMARGCVANFIPATVYIVGPPVMPESLLQPKP